MAFPFSLTYNSGTGIPISDTFDQWRIKTVAIGTDLTNVYNNLNTLYGDFVTLSGAQTITGAKTFTTTPKIQATTATLTFSEGSGIDSTLYRPTTIGGLRTDGILNIGGSSIFTPGGTPTAVLPTTTIQGNLTHSAGYAASFNSPATLTNLLTMSGSGAITGGAINNTTIGASTASTGRFTTLTATGAVTFTSGTISGTAITSSTINSTTIGASSSAAGTFSTLTSPSVTITGGSINDTPIGATTANTGKFTTLTATTALIAPWTIAQRITQTFTGPNAVVNYIGAASAIDPFYITSTNVETISENIVPSNAAYPDTDRIYDLTVIQGETYVWLANSVNANSTNDASFSNNGGASYITVSPSIFVAASSTIKLKGSTGNFVGGFKPVTASVTRKNQPIVTITPKSTTSKIKIIVKGKFYSNIAQDLILAIFVLNSSETWPPSIPAGAAAVYASEFAAGEEKFTTVEYEFNHGGNLTPRSIYIAIGKSVTGSSAIFNRQKSLNNLYTPATNASIEVTEYYQ